MTRKKLESLARRAVACKGWRWMPGMLAQNGSRIYDVMDSDDCYGDTNCHEWQNEHGWGINRCDYHRGRPLAETSAGHLWLDVVLPDLTDPATLGCLLALVREVYGDPALYVRLSDTTRQSDGVRAWEVLGWLDPAHSPDGRGGSWRGWGFASEAEALVASLELAASLEKT